MPYEHANCVEMQFSAVQTDSCIIGFLSFQSCTAWTSLQHLIKQIQCQGVVIIIICWWWSSPHWLHVVTPQWQVGVRWFILTCQPTHSVPKIARKLEFGETTKTKKVEIKEMFSLCNNSLFQETQLFLLVCLVCTRDLETLNSLDINSLIREDLKIQT